MTDLPSISPAHARYPFTSAARKKIEAIDTPLLGLIEEYPGIVTRGSDRVETAITDGTTGQSYMNTQLTRQEELAVELYSYPLARTIVSSTEGAALVSRYVEAEAAQAITTARRVSNQEGTAGLLYLLDQLGVTVYHDGSALDPSDTLPGSQRQSIGVTIADYTAHVPADGGDQWSLSTQRVSGGRVILAREQLYSLAERTVQSAVRERLPVDVPAQIQQALSEEINAVTDTAGEYSLVPPSGEPNPEVFPACIDDLYQTAVQNPADLNSTERFVLYAFLDYIGAEECLDRCTIDRTAMQSARVSRASLVPPGYETLISLGVCEQSDLPAEYEPHPVLQYKSQYTPPEGVSQ